MQQKAIPFFQKYIIMIAEPLNFYNKELHMKITFLGAGSTVFTRNVIGDCMCAEALRDSEFSLYDIDCDRLSKVA